MPTRAARGAARRRRWAPSSSPPRPTRSWSGRARWAPITRSTTDSTKTGAAAWLDWTGGRGVDHVVEVGGPGTLAQSITAVRIGGHIALIGVLTGLAGEVPTALLMRKQARLQGLIVGSRRHQMDFVRAIEATGLRPVVDRSFALADIASAFRHEEAGAQ